MTSRRLSQAHCASNPRMEKLLTNAASHSDLLAPLSIVSVDGRMIVHGTKRVIYSPTTRLGLRVDLPAVSGRDHSLPLGLTDAHIITLSSLSFTRRLEL